MGILNNEVFETIITGEYRNDNGKRIAGAYTTVDDGAILVSLSRFEIMLSGVATVDLSFEEAYTKYSQQFEARYKETHPEIKDEQEIIDKWIAEGKIEYSKTVTKADTSRANLEKAKEALSSKTSETKARVLGAILNGNSKTEAASILGLSVSTITNNLNKIKSVSDVEDLFSTYRSSVLAGVDMARLVDFKLAGCNYKAFRKRLADNFTSKIVTENAAIEREAKRKIVERKHHEEGLKIATDLIGKLNETIVKDKSRPKKSDDSVVNFSDIMNMFPVDDNTEVLTSSRVVTTSASKSKISTETADFFAEKYSIKNDTEISINSLPTSRRRFQPRVGTSSRANVTEADYGYSEI